MRSPAASIHTLCNDGRDAVEADCMEGLEKVVARLMHVGRPEVAGSVEEIEAALLATRELYEAVQREAEHLAEEIAHVRRGKRALGRYGARPAKDPRAVDLSA